MRLDRQMARRRGDRAGKHVGTAASKAHHRHDESAGMEWSATASASSLSSTVVLTALGHKAWDGPVATRSKGNASSGSRSGGDRGGDCVPQRKGAG
jgi:hypothetical protein